MARKRKTIEVDHVREKINRFLKNPDTTSQARHAFAVFLESILMETGNYHGFNYVEWMEGGYDRWVADGRPEFPEKEKYLGDQSRRHYFGSPQSTTKSAANYPMHSLIEK